LLLRAMKVSDKKCVLRLDDGVLRVLRGRDGARRSFLRRRLSSTTSTVAFGL